MFNGYAIIFLSSLLLLSVSSDELDIKEKVGKGKAFLDALDSGATIANFVDPTISLLEVATTLVHDIISFESDEDFRLTALGYFRSISSRLRRTSSEFAKVRNLIDWSEVRIGFGEYERTIMALKESLNLVLTSPKNSLEEQKQYFMKTFDSDYKNAATKLYQALTSEDLLFSDNLVAAVRKHTDDNRKYVITFLNGVFKLLVQGIEVESSYITFLNFDKSLDHLREYWAKKINQIQEIIEKVKNEITDNWYNQATKDIHRIGNANSESNNAVFGEHLYTYLRSKFDWRSWFVIVYDPIIGFREHAFAHCNKTFVNFRWHNRNVVVSSTDKESLDKEKANKLLSDLPKRADYKAETALNLVNEINSATEGGNSECEQHSLVGVVNSKASPRVYAPTDLFVQQEHEVMMKIIGIPIVFYKRKYETFVFA